ncbi:hypothetical protein SKAU_G00372670 [Synaphobranchus kaupii]|uniref:Teneurin N-terminal domain-containing protein n=1 Tax=Synaphobranchus kaupii TaxID=118154 RepID=A0A9Q1EGC3_SYNKA|nr:hypothetical protein SKAU_G00372670 [Synaphobranchus kaupii]
MEVHEVSLQCDMELPSPHAHFTFRPLPPPPPPPHACTCARPAPHAPHVPEALQRNTLPARSQSSQVADTGGAPTDCSQLHNSWVLNSNIPLETRHFLFKHGSGSSALFSAASQNYPLTSSTVYSPPPRPLPRSTFSRPAFTFSKPYKCCNWKCTALSATAVTVTLALLLAYVIAVHLFGLTWHLKPADGQLYENGVSKFNKDSETMETTFSPADTSGPDKTSRGDKGDKSVYQRGRAIDRGEVDIGTQVMQDRSPRPVLAFPPHRSPPHLYQIQHLTGPGCSAGDLRKEEYPSYAHSGMPQSRVSYPTKKNQ